MEEFIPSYEEKVGADADRLVCRTLLADLLERDSIFFTARGNTSIELALTIVRKKGYTSLLIPDQGGWMTYEKYAKKAGLKLFTITTKRGKFNQDSVMRTLETEQLSPDHCALLFSSMPAYAFSIGTEALASYCKEQGIFLINDVAASIAEEDAKYGDMIIGSFGKAKPLPLQEGGFIAGEIKQFSGAQNPELGGVDLGDVNLGGVNTGDANIGTVETGEGPLIAEQHAVDIGDVDIGDVDIGDSEIGSAPIGETNIGDADIGDAGIGTVLLEKEPELDYTTLVKLLETLVTRTQEIKKKAEAFKTYMQSQGIEVMYPEDKGYNVIVAFSNDEEKEKLIKLGEGFDKRLEHTICPRYIRTLEKAVSFEIKRYFTKEDIEVHD